MIYTAHTTETIPVLREKASSEKFKKHTKSYIQKNTKSIPIHPDYVSQFVDGKDYKDGEFEVIDLTISGEDEVFGLEYPQHFYAIPKQKEETQEFLLRDLM